MNFTRSLVLLSLAACASAPRASAPSSTPTFAPQLAVDLSAMTRSPGGLYVRELRAGDGKAVVRGTMVAVRYTGWLVNGTPIDSTKASDPPVTFRVGSRDAIRGWEEGVMGMRPGGRRQIVIPPKLGYGSQSTGVVPANSTLVFVIELVGLR